MGTMMRVSIAAKISARTAATRERGVVWKADVDVMTGGNMTRPGQGAPFCAGGVMRKCQLRKAPKAGDASTCCEMTSFPFTPKLPQRGALEDFRKQ